MYFKYFLFAIFCWTPVLCGKSGCNSAKTCGDCFGYAKDFCVWCTAYNVTDRCRPYKEFEGGWCKDSIQTSARYLDVHYDKNDDFHSSADGEPVVQLKPQKISLTARPGVPVPFELSYFRDVHYPLDVYYLMDFSWTMIHHIKKLKDEGQRLYDTLNDITNNVQIGVGSFIEKPFFPYVDLNPNVHKSYVFKDHIQMSLSKNNTYFVEKLQNLDREDLNSNYDDPEAMLDALMQVIVCDDIGWRKDSRRFIVASSDGTYHSAGDGKLVGAFSPNDMKCHIDDENKLNTQDYPSVSQINKVASDRNIKLIFAVLKDTKPAYDNLAKQIRSSVCKELLNDTNIVDLITKEYNDTAVSQLRLHITQSSYINVQLDPHCVLDSKLKECELAHNKTKTIKGTVTVNTCLKAPETVRIGVDNLNEYLEIVVNTMCSCACEEDPPAGHSEECENNGFLQCGICKCDPTRYGERCQCSGDVLSGKDNSKCLFNTNDPFVCNRHGACNCGVCVCNKGYSGPHCQYNDDKCLKYDDEICAGHGQCVEEKCHCDPGWTDDDCHCISDVNATSCVAKYSKEVCSKQGVCKCGTCHCNKGYSSPYCDVCPTCTAKRCKELKDYVICNYMRNETVCNEEFEETAKIIFNNRTEIEDPKWNSATSCTAEMTNGSYIVFKFLYDTNGDDVELVIVIQKELNDPSKANLWIAIGSTVGLVLLIGLISIVAWKFLVDMYDTREYKKFQQQAQNQAYDVSFNAGYKDPKVTFSNPTYDPNK